MVLRWSYRGGIEEYHIQWSEDGSSEWFNKYVDGRSPTDDSDNSIHTTIPGLTCNTPYSFRIRGLGDDTAYKKRWGGAARTTAKTEKGPDCTVGDSQAPTPEPPATPPPTAYQVKHLHISDRGVVTWDAPTTEPHDYRIKMWKSREMAPRRDEVLELSPRRWPIPFVSRGYHYRVRVKSLDRNGQTFIGSGVEETWEHEFGGRELTQAPANEFCQGATLRDHDYGEDDNGSDHEHEANIHFMAHPNQLGGDVLWCYYTEVNHWSDPGASVTTVAGEIYAKTSIPDRRLFTDPWTDHCSDCRGGRWYSPSHMQYGIAPGPQLVTGHGTATLRSSVLGKLKRAVINLSVGDFLFVNISY